MIRTAACALFFVLASCERAPEMYAPPEQRPPAPDLATGGTTLDMDDPDVAQHIVKDIYEPYDSAWRWTGEEPTVKLRLLATANLKLSVDFTLWDVAFRQTGPVELGFFVNRRVLETVRYSAPGAKHFEKPVPSDWLSTAGDSIVAIHVSRMFVSPDDSKKFGIIPSRIGFVE